MRETRIFSYSLRSDFTVFANDSIGIRMMGSSRS